MIFPYRIVRPRTQHGCSVAGQCYRQFVYRYFPADSNILRRYSKLILHCISYFTIGIPFPRVRIVEAAHHRYLKCFLSILSTRPRQIGALWFLNRHPNNEWFFHRKNKIYNDKRRRISSNSVSAVVSLRIVSLEIRMKRNHTWLLLVLFNWLYWTISVNNRNLVYQ